MVGILLIIIGEVLKNVGGGSHGWSAVFGTATIVGMVIFAVGWLGLLLRWCNYIMRPNGTLDEVCKVADSALAEAGKQFVEQAKKDYQRESTLDDITFKIEVEEKLVRLRELTRRQRETTEGFRPFQPPKSERERKREELERERSAYLDADDAAEEAIREGDEAYKNNPHKKAQNRMIVENWLNRQVR